MSKTLTEVTTARVRESYNAGEFTAPVEALPALIGGTTKMVDGVRVHVPSDSGLVRGRLSSAAIEAFNKARKSKGEVYGGENRADLTGGTIEVPLFSQKTGKPIKPRVATRAEVREAAGNPGKAGRISAADLTAAATAWGFGPKA